MSTRPELVAILGALLTTKSKSKVIIKTDSEAAISSINRALSNRSFKDILKAKNRAILDKIVETIDSKDLVISMCKVKAHAGVRWNEFADQLAKEATLLNDLWLWPISRQTHWNTVLTWNQIQIETPPRKFIVELKRKFVEGNWLLSKKNPGHDCGNLKNDLIWTFSWARFKEMSGQNCTSIRKSTSFTTRVKSFANLLPTLQKLHIRRPDLYTSPSCILCKSKEKKSINYLIKYNFFIED